MTTQHELDRLSLDRLRRYLTTQTIGQRLYIFGTVPSTNAVLRGLARTGLGEGAVVLAEEQTSGRRRQNLPWFSPPGVNVYLSVLLRPTVRPADVPGLARIGSISLAEAIEAEGLKPGIQWPNDIVIHGRKVAGVLVEYVSAAEHVTSVILGLGINVNVGRGGLQAGLGEDAEAATSLAECIGHEVDRNVFAARVLHGIETWYGIYRERGPEPLLVAWRARDALCGRDLVIREGNDTYEARACGIDAHGALLVRDARGEERRVLTGAIRIRD